MLQTLRQRLTLLLLAALPLHALLVTVGTKFIGGTGQAPLTVLALWKEALLGVILVIALVEVISTIRREVDILDWLIVGLVTLSIVVSAVIHYPLSTIHYLIGFKYDFIPLIAFLILRRVEWSDIYLQQLYRVLIAVGAMVSLYGLATYFAPQSFFTWLGYSDLHSLYTPDGPLAAYQQIGGSGIRRMQSTMSGPNQLGLWLLIPFGLVLVQKLRSRVDRCVLIVVSLAILLTFSRSAWIAAVVMAGMFAWIALPRRTLLVIGYWILGLVVVGVLVAPSVFIRTASSRDHLRKPIESMKMILENPFGYGLGTAGPASNRTSDTCVHLEEGSGASWAQDRPELCLFIGETQVQPEGECSCPVLPENWYLQIGVELGILGLLLYVAFIVLILKKLSTIHYPLSIFLVFLGISIAALFLHAWEDAAVAYTVWLIVATKLRH